MASSTNARSKPSSPKISLVSSSATSSPVSASGACASATLAGPTIGLFGPVPVHAGPSAKPASAKASKTRATFGRNGFGSSASAGLSCSLASNLMKRSRGSILFRLTWRAVATPSGRILYLLRASSARTNVTELASWPTPTTPSGGQTVPPGTTVTGRRPDGSKATVTLDMAAIAAGWPTPRFRDGEKNTRTMDGTLAEIERKGSVQYLSQAAMMAGWPSPVAHTGSGGDSAPEKAAARALGPHANELRDFVHLAAGWASPTLHDFRTPSLGSYADRDGGRKGEALNNQVIHQGPALIGSSAEIASGARLNPAHARWLMRIPPVWDACAVTAMPSTSRRSRT